MSNPTTTRQFLRIGQIAQRSGVSAKALRLYEQRGLLKPCTHSEAGYRLYGPTALQRLMQIVVLKRSGFTLAEIGELLTSGTPVLATALGARIAALRREVNDKTHALETLQSIARQVGKASTLDIDQLLESIAMSNTVPMQVTQSQRAELLARFERFRSILPEGAFEKFQQHFEQQLANITAEELEIRQRAWRELSASIRAAMSASIPASDPSVADLARRWHAWASNAESKQPGFIAHARSFYEKHPEMMIEQSMSPAMLDYLHDAVAVVGLSPVG